MFRGNHPARVDDKGRLKLPAEFKRVVDEKYGTQFFITSLDGKRAGIYPMQEWVKFEERLAQIANFDEAKNKLLDIVNYFGQSAEMDAQGRLLIPQILRENLNVVGDVVVLGKQIVLEVVNHESFKQQMEGNPLTAEDKQQLASHGL